MVERKRMQMLPGLYEHSGYSYHRVIRRYDRQSRDNRITLILLRRCSFIPPLQNGYVAAMALGIKVSFPSIRPFITAKFTASLHSDENVWDILFSCAFIAAAWIAPFTLSTLSVLLHHHYHHHHPLLPLSLSLFARYNSWQSSFVLAGILAIQPLLCTKIIDTVRLEKVWIDVLQYVLNFVTIRIIHSSSKISTSTILWWLVHFRPKLN